MLNMPSDKVLGLDSFQVVSIKKSEKGRDYLWLKLAS